MELFHKEQFSDARDVKVPGTEVRRSRTEENEQVVNWMKETGRIPISYMRERNGIHVECSKIFEAKIKDVLQRRTDIVGGDGRKYNIEDPENLFPVGSDICVRATCVETGRSDVYSLDFFV